MRYSKQISTGLIIESQSGGNPANPTHLQTLMDNSVSQGFTESDIEVGYMDDGDFERVMSAQMEANKTYSDKRKVEYPPATDYLDGIVKGDQGQIDKYIADCLAVKQRHPK